MNAIPCRIKLLTRSLLPLRPASSVDVREDLAGGDGGPHDRGGRPQDDHQTEGRYHGEERTIDRSWNKNTF